MPTLCVCVCVPEVGMQVGPSKRGFDADNATAEAAAAGRYTNKIYFLAYAVFNI